MSGVSDIIVGSKLMSATYVHLVMGEEISPSLDSYSSALLILLHYTLCPLRAPPLPSLDGHASAHGRVVLGAGTGRICPRRRNRFASKGHARSAFQSWPPPGYDLEGGLSGAWCKRRDKAEESGAEKQGWAAKREQGQLLYTRAS